MKNRIDELREIADAMRDNRDNCGFKEFRREIASKLSAVKEDIEDRRKALQIDEKELMVLFNRANVLEEVLNIEPEMRREIERLERVQNIKMEGDRNA